MPSNTLRDRKKGQLAKSADKQEVVEAEDNKKTLKMVGAVPAELDDFDLKMVVLPLLAICVMLYVVMMYDYDFAGIFSTGMMKVKKAGSGAMPKNRYQKY